jgi:hypothetical protein
MVFFVFVISAKISAGDSVALISTKGCTVTGVPFSSSSHG